MPLELLELRQENERLREELKYERNRANRHANYIKTQMQPLVTMGIKQAGRIKSLEKRADRLIKKYSEFLGRIDHPHE